MIIPHWFQGCQSCGDAVTFVLRAEGWEPRARCRECHNELTRGILPNVTRTKCRGARKPRRGR